MREISSLLEYYRMTTQNHVINLKNMGIAEILKKESENTGHIMLVKEGLFWKAYEKSAYIFFTNIKQYSVKKKFYKIVNSEIVSLGFPANALLKAIDNINAASIKKNEKEIVINGFNDPGKNFEQWKAKIEIKDKLNNSEGVASSPRSQLYQQILSFDVINKTPFECQQFIINLQKQMNGTLQ